MHTQAPPLWLVILYHVFLTDSSGMESEADCFCRGFLSFCIFYYEDEKHDKRMNE